MTVVRVTTIYRFVGLSSDTKPASGVPAGSEFYETDTGATYLTPDGGTTWVLKLAPVGFYRATKTVTFTGAANLGAVGAVPLFTVTGEVLIERIVPFCTTNLGEAAPTATLALGVTGSTLLLIAATNAVDIDANEFWVDTTPDANGIAVPAALKDIAITDNIIGTVAAQAVNAGVLRVDVWWRPLSVTGNVVAA